MVFSLHWGGAGSLSICSNDDPANFPSVRTAGTQAASLPAIDAHVF